MARKICGWSDEVHAFRPGLEADSACQTERTIAAPGPGEAQIAVKATGLCGSDLHYYVQ
jgi:threonine dehydrogenase-like Zn-dependent dehydrogenase